MLLQYIHIIFLPHDAIYFVKCTSPSCSKAPPQHDAATHMLHGWDGVLRPMNMVPSGVCKLLPRMNQTCEGPHYFFLWSWLIFLFSHVKQRGTEFEVNSVCWGPYDFGLILACGSSDGAISVLTCSGDGHWDIKKINNAHTIGCNAVSWAPAVVPGSLIEQPTGQKPNYIKRFVSGGCDNLVKLWKEEDGQWKEDQKLEAHSDWVRDVGWAPSIGLPTSTIASCSQDGRVFIWTCDDPMGNTWTAKLLHKFNDVVWHVSWSITGNILAVSGGDNKVTLWKESVDGQWACISDVNKGQGAVSSITDTQQSEQ
ncbi:protein SEC13 homolog isoform X2 [Myxocyprinus asiaticus]|uniref:protein SEC13 homolog isoform X2 n=1 Tax=Myxocyprinus asiaticus TaxID=70543 RepID=UPI0022234C65|nr:protein SEC13 homolog isoform X2 [Myxocyprinus asiaticus]